MRFTMSSRLVAAVSCLLLLSTLLLSVTAAPVPSSSAGLQQEGAVADARVAAREVSSSTRSASAPSQGKHISNLDSPIPPGSPDTFCSRAGASERGLLHRNQFSLFQEKKKADYVMDVGAPMENCR